MIVLGIETSCDETAAALVSGPRGSHGPRDRCVVLSSVVASQHELHAQYAGVVPELASRAHVEALLPVVREALAQAGMGLGMVDAIAVGNRPGLIGSLLVGVAGAKALAWSLVRPLVGVDHVQAHLFSGLLPPVGSGDEHVDPPPEVFPALGLVVSGGHTAMYHLDSWSSISRVGSTIDDALGEAFDKAATMLGLGHPGGPLLDALAREPGADDRAHELPISRIAPGSLDYSFSGLKTAMLYAVRGVPDEHGQYPRSHALLTREAKRNLAASFQRAACAAITLKLTRARDAARERGIVYRTLLAGGGVTANARLRAELTTLAPRLGVALRLPDRAYCMDNAAMIAGLGRALLLSGRTPDGTDLQAVPTTAC